MKKRWLAVLLLSLVPAVSRAAEPPSLRVQVVDGKGRAVAGAKVRAGNAPQDAGQQRKVAETVVSATTSPIGMARLSGLPVDRALWVLVERRGFTPMLRDTFLASGEPSRELRIVLRPGGTAVGRVVDEKGRPVAGAEVEIFGDSFGLPIYSGQLPPDPLHPDLADLGFYPRPFFPSFLRETTRHRTRTGLAGRFRFHDLPEGAFELTIRHPSFVPFRGDNPIQGDQSGGLGRFVLRRGDDLRGLVTDPEGRPIAGVPLWAVTELTERGGAPPPSATTGPDGAFVIPHLPPGVLHLYACGPGYLHEETTVRYLDEPVRLTLEPAAALRGQVLGPEGRPLAGVRLSTVTSGFLTSPNGALWTPCAESWSASSDAEGRFEVGPLEPDWYDLTAEADGMRTGAIENLLVQAGETVEGIEIRMQLEDGDGAPGESREVVTVRGRVVGPDGAPIERALVRAAMFGIQTSSLADGSFALRFPRRGTTLQVNKPGFTARSSMVDPDDLPAGGIEIRLEHGATVTGRVLGLTAEDRGQQLEIQLSEEDGRKLPASLRPDATFQIDQVPPGTWTARVSTGGRSAETKMVLEPGQTEASVEIEMAPASTVAGQVLDELAGPIGGAEIHVWGEDGSDHGRVNVRESTRRDGSFALLLPDGHFAVEVEKKGFHKAELELQVDGGAGEELEVRLAPSTTLRGRLFGLGPRAMPEIEAHGPDRRLFGEVSFDSYSITGLGPGIWTIEESHVDEAKERWILHRTIEIPPGGMDMELDLDLSEAKAEAEAKP